MIALDLISDSLPPLRTSDTGEIALQLMAEYQVKQLPIVNDKQFLGLISEEDILEQGLIEEAIGGMQLSYYKPYVMETDHLYQVMRTAANLDLSLIPVIDGEYNYKGVITLQALLGYFARNNAITEPGGILELQVNTRDYSLSEIARIVESNDAIIMSLYVSDKADSTKRMITIKVNKEDIRAIVATFERYNYEVTGYQQQSDFGDDMKDRFESFLRYMNI